MSKEYLAMYLQVDIGKAEKNPIIPVRHFSADVSRLLFAIKNNQLFTDYEEARMEIDLFFMNNPKKLAVLLDLSSQGRENIIKGNASRNLTTIYKTLYAESSKNLNMPTLGRPSIGRFTLAFGMKNVRIAYPSGFLSQELNKIFTARGLFLSPLGGAEFQLLPGVYDKTFLSAIEFSNITGPYSSSDFRSQT